VYYDLKPFSQDHSITEVIMAVTTQQGDYKVTFSAEEPDSQYMTRGRVGEAEANS